MKEQEVTRDVLLEKYAKGDEKTALDVFQRVAKGLAETPEEENDFLWALENGFIPAGRIMSAAGTDIKATLVNCFVQPVADSVSENKNGLPSIYNALTEAAETMRRGGGVGYNFSSLRPKGAKVKGTSSVASGPISYMRVFDRSCETVESAGARRGAQMGILNCDHPDIFDFVSAKSSGDLTNFNISVGVKDNFMQAVESDSEWSLIHTAEPSEEQKAKGAYFRDLDNPYWVYKVIKARDLWDKIMESTYAMAEPGVVFLDTINRKNNLYYAESIDSTNPCAEQPLPNYGCCCLGSINLTSFVTQPFQNSGFDFQRFLAVVRYAVTMLDRVIDVTYWPLEKQRKEAMNKRRIGLGFTGLGDTLAMIGMRYNTVAAREFAKELSKAMMIAAYEQSINLAYAKGTFPAFDAEKYLSGAFVRRLPESIRKDIKKHGIRNSHLLSIAPTGTISLAFADNCSNGIEPPFSWTYHRKKRTADGGHKFYTVEDHAYRVYRDMFGDKELPESFITALEISAEDHMKMLEVVQPYVDSSISKTVNVPEDYSYDDFKYLYMKAWKAGLKGLATYRPNKVLGSVLSVTPEAKPEEKKETTFKLRWPKRPISTNGHPAHTYFAKHPDGDFAVFVTEEDGVPFEAWCHGANHIQPLNAALKLLSRTMRLGDLGWISASLHGLEDFPSLKGEFWAHIPGKDKKRLYPSTAAYVVACIQHRYESLGLFNKEGNPIKTEHDIAIPNEVSYNNPSGTKCKFCGDHAVIKRDGCTICESCGHTGECG